MRKTVAAVTAGLLLVAGQAAAAGSNSAISRVGDRVGARAGDAEQLLGDAPLGVVMIGGAVFIAAVIVFTDDGDSD